MDAHLRWVRYGCFGDEFCSCEDPFLCAKGRGTWCETAVTDKMGLEELPPPKSKIEQKGYESYAYSFALLCDFFD